MSQIYLPGYPSNPGDGIPPGFPGWPGFPGRWPKPPVDNRGRLKEIYQTELGREADKEGLDYWANQLETGNQTIDQVKKNIQNSDEGRTRFLKNTYMDLLGREGDAEGMAYWDNELKSGKSREQIQESIFGSDEARKYRQKDKGRTRPPATDEGWVGQKPPKDGEPRVGIPELPEAELPGRPKKPGAGRGGDQFGGWLDFYNDQNQRKINSGGGFNKEIADKDFESNVAPGQASLTVMRQYVNPTTGQKTAVTAGRSPKAGTGWQLVDQTGGFGGFGKPVQKAPPAKKAAATPSLTTSYAPTQYAPADMSRYTPTAANANQGTSKGTAKGTAKKSSDFGTYQPATFGGNLFNQGWGNMVSWGNKFKDNKAIQGYISGAKLDSSQTMMNMGLDLLYQKGQMSQRAEYIGGLENLKTGNTMKLMAAEGGIIKDLQGQQGDIESRQIGERGDQERRGLRVAGQENRAGIKTQGDQDRKGMRVAGQENRAGMMEQGSQDRMSMAAQGIQDRMLTREKGDQERKTQRDRYREDRKMRADARGAIRRSGSRFFG